MKTTLCLLMAASSLGAQEIGKIEPRWLTNSIRVQLLEMDGKRFTNATIRKAGDTSVMVRHDDGFFAAAITNVPKSVRTNLIYHPPREVFDFVTNRLGKTPDLELKLLRGEITLSAAKEEISLREERDQQQRIEQEKALQKWRQEKAKREDREQAAEAAFFSSHPEFKKAIAERKIMMGMRRKDVIAAWGEPTVVNDDVSKRGRTSQWVYRESDSYVYFDTDGFVNYWQIRKK